MDFGLGARCFRFRLVFRDIGLGRGLLLLGFTFRLEVVAAGDVADDLLGCAFELLDGALGACFGSGVRHVLLQFSWLPRVCTRGFQRANFLKP